MNEMANLLKYIAQTLVSVPDEVEVSTVEEETAYVLKLSVAQTDMGKVIGKQGRIAKAIRTVIKAASATEDKKYLVEITEK